MLGFAVALTILVNVVMLQRRFRPLERLVDEMERADLSRPGANLRRAVDGRGDPEEVARLRARVPAHARAPRGRAATHLERRAGSAQEEERARVARDLHDEVNQSLTALLLRLEAAAREGAGRARAELAETKALANQAMEELLMLARQLRPTALDDLGLKAALAGHVEELGRQGGISAGFEARGRLLRLCPPTSSSSSTGSPRRRSRTPPSTRAPSTSGSACCASVRRDGIGSSCTVGDDGSGFTFDQAARGLGIAGMRERALLVGGDVEVESRPSVGTRVSLRVPLRPADIETRPWSKPQTEPQR